MELTILFLWLALTGGSLGQTQSNYAQCGGNGYNGGTACGSGFSCQKQNDYYWQCLPGSSSSGGLQQSGGQGAIAQYGLCGGTTYSGGGQCQSGLVCLCSDRTKSFCQPPDWKAGSDCPGSGSQGNSQPNYANTPNTLVPVTTPRPGNNFYGVQPTSSQPAAASTPNPAAVGGGTVASTSHYYDGTAGSCGCHIPGDKNTMAAWQLNPKPGWFSAAGSAKLFGSTAGTGQAAFCGTGCGSCYRLSTTGQTPPGEGVPPAAGVSFNVILTNLCPADQSAKWCGVPNQYGYSEHFDIMSQGYPMGLQNPLVTFSSIECPSDLVTLMGQCQCQNGKDTGR